MSDITISTTIMNGQLGPVNVSITGSSTNVFGLMSELEQAVMKAASTPESIRLASGGWRLEGTTFPNTR